MTRKPDNRREPTHERESFKAGQVIGGRQSKLHYVVIQSDLDSVVSGPENTCSFVHINETKQSS